MRQLLDQVARRLPTVLVAERGRLSDLSEREREVLSLVAQGLNNADIATALVIGEATVKTHVSSVLSKLGLRDSVQAAIAAYELGLIKPQTTPDP